ncbi:MAG: CYTH and CHAD domain-containing protein [Burkholderiales bacterium]|nr:CYTH and CHAD domain-containing protein [Burkholderiales bacterium]
MEIELKLLIDPLDVAALRDHPQLKLHAIEQPRIEELVSTYFDTPAFTLRENGAGLRVRENKGAYIQTFKTAGKTAQAGLHQRPEWETPVKENVPDLALLRREIGPNEKWADLLQADSLANRLQPLFTTRFRRTIWLLRLPAGDEVEFALDEGVIEHEEKSAPISEIELELKSGKPEHLFDFALALMETIPLRIGQASKAERGYALWPEQTVEPSPPAKLRLRSNLTIEQGFRRIADHCLTQMHEHMGSVLRGDSVESLHQMRVGLRRLRTCEKIFREVIPFPEQIRNELAWLAGELGIARNWDVLAGTTLPAIATDADLSILIGKASDIAQQKRLEASEVMNSLRAARLYLKLSAWLIGARWRQGMHGQEKKMGTASLSRFAQRALAHDQRMFEKSARHLKHADAARRHHARVAGKRARYGTEFFQSLYRKRNVQAYSKALAGLQEELGALNDAVTADILLKELSHRTDMLPELAEQAGFARGYIHAELQNKLANMAVLHKHIAGLKLPLLKKSARR